MCIRDRGMTREAEIPAAVRRGKITWMEVPEEAEAQTETEAPAELGAGAEMRTEAEARTEAEPVSYTHLDVYKRQELYTGDGCRQTEGPITWMKMGPWLQAGGKWTGSGITSTKMGA